MGLKGLEGSGTSKLQCDPPLDLFLLFTNEEAFRARVDDVRLIRVEQHLPTGVTSVDNSHEQQVENFVAESEAERER